jgi:hypothetical protein
MTMLPSFYIQHLTRNLSAIRALLRRHGYQVFAGALGWKALVVEDDEVMFDAGLPQGYARAWLIGGDVERIDVEIASADAFLTDGDLAMQDAFVTAFEAIDPVLKTHVERLPGRDPTINWYFDDDAMFSLIRSGGLSHGVKLCLLTQSELSRQRQEDAEQWEAAAREERRTAPLIDRDVTVPTWEEFRRGLIGELMRAEAGTKIVINQRSENYLAQFAHEDDLLIAETSHDAEQTQLSPEQIQRLQDLGWLEPSGRKWENWSHRWSWPMRAADYRLVGEMVTRALHDVYGIGTPEELEYRAWNDSTREHWQLPLLHKDRKPV